MMTMTATAMKKRKEKKNQPNKQTKKKKMYINTYTNREEWEPAAMRLYYYH